MLVAATGQYAIDHRPVPAIALRMQELHLAGEHRAAFEALDEPGPDAAILRQVLLGYISYGLSLVGVVVEAAADVDRIMQHGFLWAPPGLLVDLIGAHRTIRLLEAEQLAVPPAVVEAAERATLFAGRDTDLAKLFTA